MQRSSIFFFLFFFFFGGTRSKNTERITVVIRGPARRASSFASSSPRSRLSLFVQSNPPRNSDQAVRTNSIRTDTPRLVAFTHGDSISFRSARMANDLRRILLAAYAVCREDSLCRCFAKQRPAV